MPRSEIDPLLKSQYRNREYWPQEIGKGQWNITFFHPPSSQCPHGKGRRDPTIIPLQAPSLNDLYTLAELTQVLCPNTKCNARYGPVLPRGLLQGV